MNKTILTYVYHILPDNMIGHILYPLNQLQTIDKAIYLEEIRKYEGREHIREKSVPPLECNWLDVIFLSPIDLQVIFDTYRQVGFNVGPVKYLKIPLDDLKQENICFMDSEGDCVAFDKYLLDESIHLLPEKTVQLYKECFKIGKRPLLFRFIPHVLYKGTIDIKNYEILEA